MSPSTAQQNPVKTRRIAHRLLRSHILLAIATATLAAWLAWGFSCMTEDMVVKKLLLFAVEQINEGDYAKVEALAPMIRIFDQSAEFPPDLLPAKDYAPGFYEFEPDPPGSWERHLFVWDRPSDGKRFRAVANLPQSLNEPQTVTMLLMLLLVITLTGVAIGYLLTRKAVQPLIHLSNVVSSSQGGELPTGFSDTFAFDEIGALARQMEKYVRQREQYLQGERQFLQDASHELRTPLTVLQGALELQQSSLDPQDETSKRRLERMERSVVRMQHTVECLLWLAHEENRVLSMSKHEFMQALEGLIHEWKTVLPKEIVLTTHIESDAVLPEPLHLWLIVIRNLIENAANHTDAGTIEVDISSQRIRVSDTGCGISPDMLTSITESWVHGPKTRGYGLGLSIVNRIATRMDWSLKIESVLEQGTVVTLEP